jgi:hypothetical protein
MNQKFIKNILVGALVAISLQANASGFGKNTAGAVGKTMTSKEFYSKLGNTNVEQITANFGVPDQILTLKNTAGVTEGVVWVYESAVEKPEGLKDARLVIVHGKLKYVALSNEE